MKKRIFITLFVLVIAGLFTYWHIAVNHANKKPTCESGEHLNAPIEIPDTGIVQYQDAQFKKPSAIMFYVDWCTFCRRFMPIFGEAAKNYGDKFEFIVVNCEKPENKKIVEQFNIGGYPSLFIVDKDLDFQYQASSSATESIEAYQKELENHLKLRKKLKK